MSRKVVTGTSDSTVRRMYGSSNNFSNYAQDPMANSQRQEQMRSLSRNPSYSENGMERQRKNSLRQKFPKIQSFFGQINAKARFDQTPRDPCLTINEYENCADIPFSHIFVDEGDPDSHNDSNKSSTSSMNNGGNSSMDLRRKQGLKHSSTLPPMSEHQRMAFMKEMGKHNTNNRKKECQQSQTIGRNSSRLAAVMETEPRQPNAVFEVLKKGIELRDKPQETPEPGKSGFYFGDLDEEDENGDDVDCGSYNSGSNFEACMQASHSRRNLRNPQLATGGASSSSLKNIKKLTLTKICDKFKKLKHQPSVESSNSENEVANSRNGNSKLKSKASNGDLMKMRKTDTLYVALYNFDPIEHDDLLLRSGDFIRVVNTRNCSWWLGERGKRAGYFPSNYVMKREPHDKALLCKKTTQVHSVDDDSTWTLKRSQIVLVDGTHWKTDKSDHVYVRSATSEGYVPRLHMSLIEQ